ncbi:MAG: hydrogenase maturation protease [Candidatus Cloacimonetes bacterium]|nr:hydrogenase maturation protease [Candidatus Cloacimonadota bacterium]
MFSDKLKDLINTISDKETLFVGLGNYLRQDDAVGLYFVKQLKQKVKKNFHFILAETTPENHLNYITQLNPEYIIFIDAARFSRKVGEIRLLDTQEISSFSTSTHTSSILLIIEYLKKCIDAKYFVVGIKVGNSSFGEGISKEVLERVDRFIDLIVTQMSSFAVQNPNCSKGRLRYKNPSKTDRF